VTLAADTQGMRRNRGLLGDLARVLWSHTPRPRRAGPDDEPPTTEDALVRALCHDMRSPLAALESALGSLDRTPELAVDLLDLARAQTAHLSSMLRTAEATGGAPRRSGGTRQLCDVVQAAQAAAGLPRRLLTVELRGDAGEVQVGDARVQRILTNLLENSHRHGAGRPVRLVAARRSGWVDLSLTQAGVPADRVVGHLRTHRPPVDLTGLGLWSVQRQTRELGGWVVCTASADGFTLTVRLPDR
jgi:signal transduction histidine kinase